MTPCRESFVRLASLGPLLAEAQADGLDWLSDDEALRVNAMRSRSRREQFIAGHWLARRHAADVVGGEPRQWCVTDAGNGAVQLCRSGEVAGARMFASLSHSGAWLATAIAQFPVGVDVECPRDGRNVLALLDYCFSPPDCESVRQLPECERQAAFYRLWTLSEAQGKREGHGLRPELTRRQRVIPAGRGNAEAMSWQFGDVSLAVAGETAMRVRPTGFSTDAGASFWRFAATGG